VEGFVRQTGLVVGQREVEQTMVDFVVAQGKTPTCWCVAYLVAEDH
jgi:hypothetical protein